MTVHNLIALSVPADPAFIHIVRSVTGAAAARHEFTYEGVDDLRIAVDEACTRLLSISNPGSRISLEIQAEADQLRIRASIDAVEDGVEPRALWPTGAETDEIAWTIMRALADAVDAGSNDGTSWIELSKRPPSPA